MAVVAVAVPVELPQPLEPRVGDINPRFIMATVDNSSKVGYGTVRK